MMPGKCPRLLTVLNQTYYQPNVTNLYAIMRPGFKAYTPLMPLRASLTPFSSSTKKQLQETKANVYTADALSRKDCSDTALTPPSV